MATIEDLIRWRKGGGLSRAQAAEVLGVSYDAIVSWEIGRRRFGGAAGALLDVILCNPEIAASRIAAVEKMPR